MEYYTVKEIAVIWGVSARMVSLYCKENRIDGALKKGNMWLVPQNAQKPCDMRINNGKRKRTGGTSHE